MATHESQPAVIGSWKWGDNPAPIHVCDDCQADWRTVVSATRAPQSFHTGGVLRMFETGQSGMCRVCTIYWKELQSSEP